MLTARAALFTFGLILFVEVCAIPDVDQVTFILRARPRLSLFPPSSFVQLAKQDFVGDR